MSYPHLKLLERVTLGVKCLAIERRFSHALFVHNHARVEEYADDVARDMVVQLVSFVAAGKRHPPTHEIVHETVVVRWPATWWQALKLAVYERLPKWRSFTWLATRRPVVYAERSVPVKVDRYETLHCCPHLDLKVDPRSRHFEFLFASRPRDAEGIDAEGRLLLRMQRLARHAERATWFGAGCPECGKPSGHADACEVRAVLDLDLYHLRHLEAGEGTPR